MADKKAKTKTKRIKGTPPPAGEKPAPRVKSGRVPQTDPPGPRIKAGDTKTTANKRGTTTTTTAEAAEGKEA